MDLIENYLGAVRWNLPAGKADDILAELADVIANRIEEREDRLGRALRRDEVSEVLREFGHPLQVAGRYHGQRVLIGAEVFPFYWFVLRIVLAIVAVVEVAKAAGHALFGGDSLMRALAHSGHDLFNALLVNAAIVTLIFAVIEHTGLLARYLESWKPDQLPKLRFRLEAPKRRRMEPVFEIVFGIAFILWWVGLLSVPIVPDDSDVTVRMAPVWATLYWPVIALAALGVLRGLVALVAPGWKPLRAALAIGSAAGVVAIAWVLHQAGRLVLVSPAGLGAADAVEMQRGLDIALGIAVSVVPVVVVIQCAAELWRISRER